jgi:hypothetical protein
LPALPCSTPHPLCIPPQREPRNVKKSGLQGPPPSSPPGAREAGTGGRNLWRASEMRCNAPRLFFFLWWGIKRGVVGAFDGVFLRDIGKAKTAERCRHGAGLLAQVRCGVAWLRGKILCCGINLFLSPCNFSSLLLETCGRIEFQYHGPGFSFQSSRHQIPILLQAINFFLSFISG